MSLHNNIQITHTTHPVHHFIPQIVTIIFTTHIMTISYTHKTAHSMQYTQNMGLAVGKSAFAVIKASDVMIGESHEPK